MTLRIVATTFLIMREQESNNNLTTKGHLTMPLNNLTKTANFLLLHLFYSNFNWDMNGLQSCDIGAKIDK